MSIVAYASHDANPTANPHVDAFLDLSDPLVVLPKDVQLNGDCIDDTGDPGPFTYRWYMMAIPPGSAAVFNDDLLQSPTLEDVDIWGNYRVFVVATNTNTGITSQQDPLRAPSSAFCVVRVLSPKQTIQKPAAGERNWMNDVWEWAQRIEDFESGMAPHNIIDHLDVVDATGFDLEVLTGGGYVDDPEPGATGAAANPANPFGHSLLHKHYGSDVDLATIATPGTIYLDDGFVGDPDHPTALTDDFSMLSAHTWMDLDEKMGLVPHVVVGRPVPGHGTAPLFVFNIPKGNNGTWVVRNYGVHFNRVGPDPSRYRFELVKGDHAAPLNIATIVGSEFNMAPLVDIAQIGAQHWSDWAHEANGGSVSDIGTVIGGTDWLGFRVIDGPDFIDDMAQGITVTIFLRRNT
jgi:hypothetical protein